MTNPAYPKGPWTQCLFFLYRTREMSKSYVPVAKASLSLVFFFFTHLLHSPERQGQPHVPGSPVPFFPSSVPFPT